MFVRIKQPLFSPTLMWKLSGGRAQLLPLGVSGAVGARKGWSKSPLSEAPKQSLGAKTLF